jgi:putative transcriptional regulator
VWSRILGALSLHKIEPGLLLAAPRLGDPNFERTVVLLGLHGDDEGSLGWTMNGPVIERASTIVRATGLVDEAGELPHRPGFARHARRGGPVSRESVWILYAVREGVKLLPGSLNVQESMAVTSTPDALRALVAGDGPDDFRLLVGYAGWAPGQLAEEMSEGAWLPAPIDAALLLHEDVDTLWERAYDKAIGTVPTAFVTGTRGSA